MSNRNPQIRLVLTQKHKPLADRILDETGIETYTQLLSIFIVNYGEILIHALKGQPSSISALPQPQSSTAQVSPKAAAFTPMTEF